MMAFENGLLLLLAALIVSSVYAQSSSSCSGTYTISSSSDASALSCSSFDGDIIIASAFAGQMSLDGVTRITGDVNASNASQLTAISASRLLTIEGSFILNELQILSTLQMPYLSGVNRINWTALPALQSLNFAQGLIQANQVTITNTGLTDLKGIELTAVGSVNINNNPYLRTVNVNNLRNITSTFSVAANGLNVQYQFPNLQSAANISVRNASGLSVPSLATVQGAIGLYSNYFSTFAAPNLTQTGNTLAIVDSSVTNLSLPLLKTIGGGLLLANNTNLAAISLPALTTINGDLNLYGTFDIISFPSLSNIRGAASIYTTSSNSTICQLFQSAKTAGIIKGKVTCANNASSNVTSSGGAIGSGTSSGDTSSGGTTGNGSGPGNGSGTESAKSGHGGGLSGAAIAGIVVGVVVVILVIVAALLLRRHKRKQRALAGVKANPHANSNEKPELYAGPIDTRIAGPVKPKHELSTKTDELHSPGHAGVTGIRSHEVHGQTSSNAPWAHGSTGYLPPELNSTQIHEANTRSLQPLSRGSVHYGFSQAGDGSVVNSQTTSSMPHQSQTSESVFDDSELVEEADVAVQELGLISVRKRALVSQARAGGCDPTELPGRKAEEWQGLLEREQKIKLRLNEIERLRGSS